MRKIAIIGAELTPQNDIERWVLSLPFKTVTEDFTANKIELIDLKALGFPYTRFDNSVYSNKRFPKGFNKAFLTAGYRDIISRPIRRNVTIPLPPKDHILSVQAAVNRAKIIEGLRRFNNAPIDLSQWDDYYFLKDGNHRMVCAYLLKHPYIVANIQEFVLRKN